MTGSESLLLHPPDKTYLINPWQLCGLLLQPLRHVRGRPPMLYMNNEKSLPTVFLLCLAMYKVKCELSMAGAGGIGDTARYTGMDNYIFVVRGFQMTELKSY